VANELTTTTNGINREQIELIKNTVAVGATDTELKLFLYQAEKRGLDPLTRQIHFIKRQRWDKDSKGYIEVGTIQTGIDGFRLIADRTGKLSGIKRGVITNDKGELVRAWAEVFRKDWTEPAREEVSFKEYCQLGKEGQPMGLWKTMPETMLKKVAEAAALRMAFPENLSGLYSDDEMSQADTTLPVKIEVSKPEPKKLADKAFEKLESAGSQPTAEATQAPAKVTEAQLAMMSSIHSKIVAKIKANGWDIHRLADLSGEQAAQLLNELLPK
jgi:phage recombination protein Bet